MTQIEESDFRPLDQFPLKWRWTDSRWNELPADALKAIQPFTESKARELVQYSLTFSDASGLSESRFEEIYALKLRLIRQESETGCSTVPQTGIGWSLCHGIITMPVSFVGMCFANIGMIFATPLLRT